MESEARKATLDDSNPAPLSRCTVRAAAACVQHRPLTAAACARIPICICNREQHPAHASAVCVRVCVRLEGNEVCVGSVFFAMFGVVWSVCLAVCASVWCVVPSGCSSACAGSFLLQGRTDGPLHGLECRGLEMGMGIGIGGRTATARMDLLPVTVRCWPRLVSSKLHFHGVSSLSLARFSSSVLG